MSGGPNPKEIRVLMSHFLIYFGCFLEKSFNETYSKVSLNHPVFSLSSVKDNKGYFLRIRKDRQKRHISSIRERRWYHWNKGGGGLHF